MIDETLALIRAHRNNIQRYRRLLATRLSELERAYIERRLQEEETAANALLQTAFPFKIPSAGLPVQTAA